MRRISILIVIFFALQLCGCGTILHPERKGQSKSYRLDPAVAILDGVGVLFFLIPGLLAFAVDFHYGTIFLPPDKSAHRDNKKLKIVHVDPDDLNTDTIENIIKNETGHDIKLTQDNLIISELNDRNEFRLKMPL